MKSAMVVLRSHSLFAATALAGILAVTACSSDDKKVEEPVSVGDIGSPSTPSFPETPAAPTPDMAAQGSYGSDTSNASSSAVGSSSVGSSPASSSSDGMVTRYVSSHMLNVRAKPELKAKIVSALLGGTSVQCQDLGKYCKIKEGQFVRTKYLSASPTKKVTMADLKKSSGPAIGAGTPKKGDKDKKADAKKADGKKAEGKKADGKGASTAKVTPPAKAEPAAAKAAPVAPAAEPAKAAEAAAAPAAASAPAKAAEAAPAPASDVKKP